MKSINKSADLGISSRIRRSQGRFARNAIASAKVTQEERLELATAAENAGKAFSEWAREVLLREARSGVSDRAVFTELIAMRMLLNMTLRPLYLGETGTLANYDQILAEAKNGKHETAAGVLKPYQMQRQGDR